MICCVPELAYFILLCLSLLSVCGSVLTKPFFFIRQRDTDTFSQTQNATAGNSSRGYKVEDAMHNTIMKLLLTDNSLNSQRIDEYLSKGCRNALVDIAMDIVNRQDYSKLKISKLKALLLQGVFSFFFSVYLVIGI